MNELIIAVAMYCWAPHTPMVRGCLYTVTKCLDKTKKNKKRICLPPKPRKLIHEAAIISGR